MNRKREKIVLYANDLTVVDKKDEPQNDTCRETGETNSYSKQRPTVQKNT